MFFRKKRLWLGMLLLPALWLIWYYFYPGPVGGNTRGWDLTQYRPAGPVISIAGIERNLSGITYHPESGLLYAVTNFSERVHVLTKTGILTRTIELHGFDDTESIAHLYDNTFIVAEERRGTVVRIEINDTADKIHRKGCVRYRLTKPSALNKGIEGVAWSQHFGLFAVREWPPRVLHHPVKDHHSDFDPSGLQAMRLRAWDFAGLCVLPGPEETLLILSEASHSLHVVDMRGRELSRISLSSGRFGGGRWMQKPEGVTVDDNGRIYIVGEPNELLVLERRPEDERGDS